MNRWPVGCQTLSIHIHHLVDLQQQPSIRGGSHIMSAGGGEVDQDQERFLGTKKHKIQVFSHQNTLIHIFCHQAENFDTGTAGDKYQVCLCVFDMGHLAEVVREATSLPPPGSLTWKKCSLTWKFKNSLLGSCQRASFPVFNLSPPHLYSLT